MKYEVDARTDVGRLTRKYQAAVEKEAESIAKSHSAASVTKAYVSTASKRIAGTPSSERIGVAAGALLGFSGSNFVGMLLGDGWNGTAGALAIVALAVGTYLLGSLSG